MTTRVLTYMVGSEYDPGDPWGRSELVIEADGGARLDHHFPAGGPVRAWTGRVDSAALEALWSALRQAGFPTAPATPLTPGAAPRRLTLTADGESQHAMIGYHEAAGLVGYAEAFDILDGIARQLSGDVLPYPTRQSPIVHDHAEASSI